MIMIMIVMMKASLLYLDNKFEMKSNAWKSGGDKKSDDDGNYTIDTFLSQIFCHCI